MDTEPQYLVQQVASETPRSSEVDVSTWFKQTQDRLKKNHEWRSMFTAPVIRRHQAFYGLSKIVVPGESMVELSEHSIDKDYKEDYNYLSLIIHKGIQDRQFEQYIVMEDKNTFRWFMREQPHDEWKEMAQNKVPLYAIFAISDSVK